jgi:heme/copper-type cytochrome/quinol oxidase subunit 2
MRTGRTSGDKRVVGSLPWAAILAGSLLWSACATSPPRTGDLALSGAVSGGRRVVVMTAKQYAFAPDPVVVRTGEIVQLEVTSLDVTHGIGIEGTSITRTLQPHKTETVSFTAGAPGTYGIHCTEFCGMGHFGMSGKLIVLPEEGAAGAEAPPQPTVPGPESGEDTGD